MTKKTIHTVDDLSINALEIILTGPFQICDPLDFSQTTTDEYKTKQEAVKERMEELFEHYEWKIPKSGGGQKYERGSGGTGKAHSPSYYLECSIKCNKIEYNLEKYNFAIKEMKVKFYEFGFATVSVSGIISSKFCNKANKQKIRSGDLLSTINELGDIIVKGEAGQIKALISNITKKFVNTIRENNIMELFLSEKISQKITNANINNIRSLHRIFKYKVNKNSEIEFAQTALNKIAKLSNGLWKKENSFSHFVGVANSAIVYNCNIESDNTNIDGKILERYRSEYENVLETANAYYFIAEFIKNGLSDYSRESVAIKKLKGFFKNIRKYKEHEKIEDNLNKYIMLTSIFFYVSDEYKINLGPQGKNIWNEMEKAWSTEETTKMLQDQLQNSLLITGRILKQISNKAQRWLRNIAGIFTVIGAISLVEISQSKGFHWDFHYFIWNADNLGDAMSKIINFLGSILAVFLVLGIFLGLPIYFIWGKRENNNSENCEKTEGK